MAEQWPSLHVHGIDILDTPLALAAENRSASVARDRVTFEKLNFKNIQAKETYCGAFVAGAFIPLDAASHGIRVLYDALESGGWVFYGLYRSEPDALSRAITSLRLARSGGHLWSVPEIESLLDDVGFQDLTIVEGPSVAMFVAGRKL